MVDTRPDRRAARATLLVQVVQCLATVARAIGGMD